MSLTEKNIKTLGPGWHFDNSRDGVPGLYLAVTKSGAGRSFMVRCHLAGKMFPLGLGSVRENTLAQAREAALEIRRLARSGVDPRTVRAGTKAAEITFAMVAEDVIAKVAADAKEGTDWASAWRQTLEDYAYPTLGDLPVASIDAMTICEALRPIWLTKKETARRTLQRIGRTLELARARNLYEKVSPLAAVRVELGKQKHKAESFAAVPLEELPRFVERLRRSNSSGAMALEFLTLTASRTEPVLELVPAYIEGDIWTTPDIIMKGEDGKAEAHMVPLAPAALEIVERGQAHGGARVFCNQRTGRPLSNMAMLNMVKDVCAELGLPPATTHGMRSAFRGWCDREGVRDILASRALAHKVGDATEQAYRRRQLCEERRPVMLEWARFLRAA